MFTTPTSVCHTSLRHRAGSFRRRLLFVIVFFYGIPLSFAFIQGTPANSPGIIGSDNIVAINGLASDSVATSAPTVAEATYPLPEVLVTSRKPESPLGMPGSQTISSDQWSRQGARSLSEALRLLPGLEVLTGDHSVRLSINGSPARAVQVDLDGVPLGDLGSNECDVGSIELSLLSSICIEPSGLGGVVHLTSLSRQPTSSGQITPELKGSIGSSSAKQLNGHIEGNNAGLIWGVAGGAISDPGRFQYRLDDGSMHYRVNNSLESKNAEVKLGYRAEGIEASFSGNVEQSTRGIPGLIHSAPTPEASRSSRRMWACASSNFLTSWGEVAALGYIQKQRTTFISPQDQFNPANGEFVRTFPERDEQAGQRMGLTIAVKRPYKLGMASLSIGRQDDEYLGRDLLRNTNSVAGIGRGAARRITDKVEFSTATLFRWPVWSLTGESRLSQSRLNESDRSATRFTSGSISVGIGRDFPWASVNLRTGVSRSLAPPNFNALFTTESAVAVGNPALRPEQGDRAEVGLSVGAAGSWATGSVSCCLFLTEAADLIVWQRNAFGKYYPENVASTTGRGLELSGNFSSAGDRLRLSGSYIINRIRIATPGDVNSGNYVPLVPLWSGSINAGWFPDQWRMNVGVRWVGRRYSTESNYDPISVDGMGLSPYQLVNTSLGYNIKAFRLNWTTEIAVDNLLDANYRVVERTPQPGREYRIQFTIAG